jgi:hypothetical protein
MPANKNLNTNNNNNNNNNNSESNAGGDEDNDENRLIELSKLNSNGKNQIKLFLNEQHTNLTSSSTDEIDGGGDATNIQNYNLTDKSIKTAGGIVLADNLVGESSINNEDCASNRSSTASLSNRSSSTANVDEQNYLEVLTINLEKKQNDTNDNAQAELAINNCLNNASLTDNHRRGGKYLNVRCNDEENSASTRSSSLDGSSLSHSPSAPITRSPTKMDESNEKLIIKEDNDESILNHYGDKNNLELISSLPQEQQCAIVNEENVCLAGPSTTSVEFSDDNEEIALYNSTINNNSNDTLMKRTHLKSLIYELYNFDYETAFSEQSSASLNFQNESLSGKDSTIEKIIPSIICEGYVEKLPPGSNMKNSLLLTWKRRYLKLNSIGNVYVYDIDEKTRTAQQDPIEVYNIMGGKADYEQNRVICIDDSRGNCIVIRPCSNHSNKKQQSSDNSFNNEEDDLALLKWKAAIDSQIEDRADSLWIKPKKPLTLNNNIINMKICREPTSSQRVLIIDIGTCSIRAGLFSDEGKL